VSRAALAPPLVISAIIPTVGRPDTLRVCMSSVLRQTTPIAEVIVVHCGDDPETESVTADPRWRAAGLDCRYFRYPERNAAAQRNFAVERAKGEFLLLLDDDVELEPAWTTELFKPIWQDERVGATMGRMTNQRMEEPTLVWRLYRRMLPGDPRRFEPGRLIGAVMPNGFPSAGTTPVPAEWLGAGVTAIRRAAFLSVGGFAPYFCRSSPGEDLDLGYRLSRHWSVLYVPTACCIHHQHPSGRERAGDYQFESMRSRYAILLRAFGKSPAAALAHILYWVAFQSVSEMASLRKGLRVTLLSAWWGRLRGIVSCVLWRPPINHERPDLFPMSQR
jgi:O-antigen biosynthesis protein